MNLRPLALVLLAGTAAAQQSPPAKTLGILVFPGVQVIDFTGPYEVLKGAHTGPRLLFDTFTVGLTHDEFRAGMADTGLRLRADYDLADCPELDILVIPGGDIGPVSDDPQVLDWVRRTAQGAECVMSVCNGAFVLAEAGLLAHQKATTFHWFLDELAEAEPTCTVVHDQRFVDNGKIITTAGLSSGIDGALHLIERYGSRFDAEQRALGLEYHWQPELNWSRANLADRHLISLLGSAGFEFPDEQVSDWTTVENNGTTEQWTKRWTFGTPLAQDAVRAVFESKLATSWHKAEGPDGAWTFEDDQGRPWVATLTLVEPDAGHWTAAIHLQRG